MPPLVWADVATSTSASRDVLYDQRRSAFSNREAKIAAQIVNRLVGLGICPSDIGVVTLFKAHARAVENALDHLRVSTATLSKKKGDDVQTPEETLPLRDSFVAEKETPSSRSVPPESSGFPNLDSLRGKTQVSTVDAFQGQEKEVIVLSLCGGGGGAFASDERLNVALTRAKRHLIVLGDSRDPASS
jgi:superfamily I DNA and/or RNA helicase